jgi:type III pantothenate kinase
MHKLIIDFGNTLQKLAIYDGKTLLEKQSYQGIVVQQLVDYLDEKGPFDAIILSSVARHSPEIEKILSETAPLVILDENTPLPVKNLYLTPATLGKDRLAAAAGANALYPGKNVLSIDAGTCITYDFLTENAEYLGGGISPGIRMRFRAMNAFTGRLPLVEPGEFSGLIGRDTQESLLSGVLNGVSQEITGIIRLYTEQYKDITVVITGGDLEYLHNKLKINIFAVPDLVLLGLNEILDCHDIKR